MEKLVSTSSLWHDQRVLITGHTGFKGSWLSLLLGNLGAQLNGISLEANKHSLFNTLALTNQFSASKVLDIRNSMELYSAVDNIQPDIIFHLAAQPIVSVGYSEPVETYTTNIVGTLNLLETIRRMKNKPRAVVVVTSDKCYENSTPKRAFSEGDRLGGCDPYSSSKACADILSSAYYESYFKNEGIGLATVRAGNVIGGGDFSQDRLFPDIVKAVQESHTLILRNPRAVRPWQHVLEPVFGYIQLAEKLFDNPANYSGAWNFGPSNNSNFSVKDIVLKAQRFYPMLRYITESSDYYEASYLNIDSTKAKKNLGWKPILEIDESIEWTLSWYSKYLEAGDTIQFTLSQIDEYLRRTAGIAG